MIYKYGVFLCPFWERGPGRWAAAGVGLGSCARSLADRQRSLNSFILWIFPPVAASPRPSMYLVPLMRSHHFYPYSIFNGLCALAQTSSSMLLSISLAVCPVMTIGCLDLFSYCYYIH